MTNREQFGNYLLLKKLGEDALGETFRAARMGAQGMDQVLLLRVFNATGLDGAALWRELAPRRPVQQALSSPNVATGIDLGEVRGLPFVAYDYISGKSLAELARQAAKRRHPVPTEQALLIVDRIALALAVGYETRVANERVLHGAVVPQLVMISNEGETRLLGFEAAPGLRRAIAGGLGGAQLAAYLSPEARAGQPASKSDDVWSLGAILLELVSGKPVTAGVDPAAQIAAATLEPEGTPLPEALGRLLAQSLTTADKRIGDVVAWHKSLAKVMFEGQHNPTTFNLAFYMHNLFKEEIEKESQEIEVERTMKIPAAAVAAAVAAPPPKATPAAAATPASGDVRETTGVRENTDVIRDRYGIAEEDRQSKGRRSIVLGAVAAVLVLAIAGTVLFLRGRDAEPEETVASQPAPVAPVVVPQPAAEAPDPDAAADALAEEQAAAEEAQRRLAEQIDALVAERTKNLEQRLAGQYDGQIEALRSQLADEQERAQEAVQAQRQLPTTSAPPAERAATAAERPAGPTATNGTNAPATRPATTPAGGTESAGTPPTAPAAQPAPARASEPQPTQPRAAEPPPAAPAPADPGVTVGDLVNAGEPGSKPPELASVRQPRYPPQAARMRKEATVVVRVLVDENGRVTEAELVGEPAGFGMDQEALAAARSARYQPATKNGVRVKMWSQLKFPFKP